MSILLYLRNYKTLSLFHYKIKIHCRQDAHENLTVMPFQFGGDIAANVILAAATRLPALSNLRPMSVNVDYVSPGDYAKVRYYHVDRLRQSGRFVHTLVRLLQDHQTVAIGTVAFHSTEGDQRSLQYNHGFPKDCPMPDELKFDKDVLAEFEKKLVF